MNISAFIIYCIVVTFTPGPTNIVILSSVQHHGARKTMVYVWGATLAFGLLLAASALLNQLLAGILPEILRIMQITGSVYMLYLAYQVYHMGRGSGADARYSTGFHSGLLMQFANPKVLLFTLTVIPGYVLPYHPSSAATLGFVSADILALSASMTDFTYKSTAMQNTPSASPCAAFSNIHWTAASSPRAKTASCCSTRSRFMTAAAYEYMLQLA